MLSRLLQIKYLLYQPGVHSAESLWRSLGFAACKLLPVAYARELKFDVNLRSGEDVAYFSPFFARGSFQFDSTPSAFRSNLLSACSVGIHVPARRII